MQKSSLHFEGHQNREEKRHAAGSVGLTRSQAALPQDCEPMAFSGNLPLRAARTCGTGLSDGRNLVVVTKRRLDMRRLARLHCSAQPTQWRTSAHACTPRRKQRAHTDSAKSHALAHDRQRSGVWHRAAPRGSTCFLYTSHAISASCGQQQSE